MVRVQRKVRRTSLRIRKLDLLLEKDEWELPVSG